MLFFYHSVKSRGRQELRNAGERLLPESGPFLHFVLATEEASRDRQGSPTPWQGLCRVGIKSPSFLRIPQAQKGRKAERSAKVNKISPLLQAVEFRVFEVSSDSLAVFRALKFLSCLL